MGDCILCQRSMTGLLGVERAFFSVNDKPAQSHILSIVCIPLRAALNTNQREIQLLALRCIFEACHWGD